MGFVLAAAGVAAAGSVASGMIQSNAAKNAAEAGAGPMRDALGFQKGVYDTTQTNLMPYVTTGQQALGGLAQFTGLAGAGPATTSGMPGGSGALASYNQFTKTPFYTFPEQTFEESIRRNASTGQGGGVGAGELAGIGKMAGNYAASNFSNYIGALQNLAGMGQTSAGTIAQSGGQIGQQVGATDTQLGSLQAASAMAQGTAQSNMVQGITQALAGQGMTSGYGGGSGGLISAAGRYFTPTQFGSVSAGAGSPLAAGYVPPAGSGWTGRDNMVPYGQG
jgi:hypothetical protein